MKFPDSFPFLKRKRLPGLYIDVLQHRKGKGQNGDVPLKGCRFAGLGVSRLNVNPTRLLYDPFHLVPKPDIFPQPGKKSPRQSIKAAGKLIEAALRVKEIRQNLQDFQEGVL